MPSPLPNLPAELADTTTEANRLHALYRYGILDTDADERYDRITGLAQRWLDAPIALISFVDHERQWFKSCIGLDIESTARDLAFCAHAIESDDVMVIEDAEADARFASNPFVTGPPHIRFYAGAPLIVPGGQRVGTLSIIDTAPRTLRQEEIQTLEELAAIVVDELELRRESAERRSSEHQYRTLFESANDAVLILRPEDEVVLKANEQAAKLYGIERDKLVGRSLEEFSRNPVRGRLLIEELHARGHIAFETGQRRADGTPIAVRVSASLIEYDGQPAILNHSRDVTALKEAEAALRLRARELQAITDHAPQFITRFDNHLRYLFVNRLFVNATGIPADAFLGSTNEELGMPAAYVSVWNRHLRTVLETGSMATFTFELEERQYRAKIVPEQSSGPTVETLLAITHDVTEQKQSQARLAEREAYFRTLIARSSDLISILHPDGRILYKSPSVESILGYDPELLVGQNIFPYVHPDDLEGAAKAFFELGASQGGVTSATFRWRHADGSWIVLEMVGMNCMDDPAIGGIVVNSRDVTERKQAREALQASERRYRSVVENVRDVVLQTDTEGRWTFLNTAWEQITGFSVEESLGRSFFEFVHPDEPCRRDELFAPLIEDDAPFVRFETRLRTKGGDARNVEIHAQLIHAPDGAVTGASGTISDITDTVRFEAEREARRQTEEMLRLKNAFFNNMSHEIRTPLTGILGFTEVLAEEIGPSHREPVEIIRTSAHRLLDTLSALLNLAQLEGGAVEMTPQQIRVDEEIHEAVALLRPLAERKGLQLRVEAPPTTTLLDRNGLKRIVNSLVGNAVKFTETGHVTVRLESTDAHAGIGGPALTLQVTDTGIGINEAFLPHLFDEFRQASQGFTRSHEGSGVGLAITQRLVRLMGGTIAVKSTVGEGTTFTVTLPHSGPALEDTVAEAISAAA